ncbi:MAG: hypothetical protein RBU30_27875 [Polyangia bacterium]|jgi:hypothetical protein|nr:hypothetical protein [Polyangia bacterium]
MHSKTRLAVSMLLVAAAALLVPAIGRAKAKEGLLMMASGQEDCRAGRHAAGVKKLTDAAVLLQQADPGHAANRQWLPRVQVCLEAWVKHAQETCRREGTVEALQAFQTIETAMKYLAAPAAKRLAQVARPRCAQDIVNRQVKACLAEAGRSSVDGLVRLKERLAGLGVEKGLLGKLADGTEKCVGRWVKEADGRCVGASTVEFLKDIADAVTRSGPAGRPAAHAAYERCAKAMGTRAFSICQSRRYQQGRALLGETIGRYGFFPHKDRAFLKKMQREWWPLCGSYVATGYFKASVRRGAVQYSLEARLTLEVGRSGKGDELLGELRAAYSAVSGKQQGCRVLITPTDGRYSLSGTENRALGSMKMALDKSMPQTEAFEDIQVTCGERAPELSKGHFLHHLITKAGLLALALPTRQGESKRFEIVADLPERAKGSLAGTMTVKQLAADHK